jgi:hypothetical protein
MPKSLTSVDFGKVTLSSVEVAFSSVFGRVLFIMLHFVSDIGICQVVDQQRTMSDSMYVVNR